MEKKIDFLIQKCDEGLQKYPHDNSSSWINSVKDLREVIHRLKYSNDDNFYCLRFVEDGVLFVVGYLTGGSRGDEYTAVWMYIPSVLIFTLNDDYIFTKAQHLQNCIRQYAQHDPQIIYNEINNKEFKQERYQEGTSVPFVKSPLNKEVGILYYKDEMQFRTFLNPLMLKQKEYEKYSEIFFAKKDDAKEYGKQVIELSTTELKKLTIVSFPNFSNGIEVYLEENENKKMNGQKIPLLINDEIGLVFRRKPFRTISYPKVRVAENMKIDSLKLNWTMDFNRIHFIATDLDGKIIELKSENIKVPKGIDKQKISEVDAQNLKIEFNVPRYTKTVIVENLLLKDYIHIVLKPETEKREYCFKLRNGKDYRIVLEERKTSEPTSPLIGYRLEEHNRLIHIKSNKKKFLILGIILGVVFGVLLAFIVNSFLSHDVLSTQNDNLIGSQTQMELTDSLSNDSLQGTE